MEQVTINGATLEYAVQGAGEPLVLIHGAILADAFYPLLHAPALANSYRIITYHRRGFAGSDRAPAPFSIDSKPQIAGRLLTISGFHVPNIAGHSYGAITALQLALDSPDVIRSLALLEPLVLDAIPSGPSFGTGLEPIIAIYKQGDKAGAVDGFLAAVLRAGYRQILEKTLPPGALELAVTDLDTFFQVEMPALQAWRFTAADAQHIHEALGVRGSIMETAPIFRENP